MYPTILRIGSFELSSYGLMMAVAFLVTGVLLQREMGRQGLRQEWAFELVWRAALGGVLGAKIYYALLYRDWHALLSRGGLVWYGGLIGGAALVLWYVRRQKMPLGRVGDLVALYLPLGYAIGRVGCFLVGDDYGRPTDSWVGIAFPHGLPPSTAGNLRAHFGVHVPAAIPDDQVLRVHPTQLYEIGMSLLIFALAMRLKRRERPQGWFLALILTLMSVERFIVEFFRAKDDRLLGIFTIAQLISVLIATGGLVALWRLSTTPAGRTPSRPRAKR